ncbi:LOG family protein [Sphingobacterium griseoflavum]|uniref:Cytokinin riboside 5'-monophosphate phosphoribohydrolase n=1 Tax=Sphingobacterium griseoflavum TaxID=1474952 RepID=A0ABQ3HWM8_9SPHI|nr:TIGR00730 family Rossman fold protein [Sphingobacterium griseoflavum]GHE28474.1 cytokinin riboside 5'-monophosphate phosphoribohydrolase [Sphingobacterium griseoflavum]
MKLKSIVVFCASSFGHSIAYSEQAARVGQVFAERGIQLVYGGGKVGLMGTVANAALEAGGKVVGVIPHFLNSKEREHTGVTTLITVDTMHDRKRIMNDYAEGVIALPGGFGTLEELFEMITWAQLGLHKKPVGLLNTNNFYQHLIHFIDHMVSEGLLKKENREMLLIADTIEELLEKMERYEPVAVTKWIKKDDI